MKMKRSICIILSLMLVITACMASGDVFEPDYIISPVSIEPSELPAASAILVDLKSGAVLYEKNADEPLPPASITKIMTMLLVIEAVHSGKISFDDIVTVTRHAASMGGSQIYLQEGEKMSVAELYKAVSIASANDAAVALAEHVSGSEAVFVSLMNKRAAELGMKNTVFKNACGLDKEGHVSTARDVAIVSVELCRYEETFWHTTTWIDSVRNGNFQLVNTNKLIRRYNGITGLKTGSTGRAKYCMSGTATREDISLCAVVMGCDTTEQRFDSVAALLDFGFANFVNVDVTDGIVPPEIKVKFGVAEKVKTEFAAEKSVLVPAESSDIVIKSVDFPKVINAPIAKGRKIGTLTVSLDGKTLESVDIVAAEDIGKLGFFRAFWWLLRSIGLF